MSTRLVFSPRYVINADDSTFATRKFALVAELLRGRVTIVEPQPPSREDLLLAHTPAWVDKVLLGRLSAQDEKDVELALSPELIAAHALAVSGTILACRHALTDGIGLHAGGGAHHAFADFGGGFCLLNDIACGILKMRAEKIIRRAAVIDLDVHQGNGTASILKNRDDIFTFSMHQEDLYPEVKISGSLDVGVDAGMGDEEYLQLLKEALPRVFAHGPELIVYQAGVDVWEYDQRGGLKLTETGLRRRDEMVAAFCKGAHVPVAVTLGGGYGPTPEATARLHAQTLTAFM